MEVKFLGHGCLEISVSNKKIVVDPFISGNPKNNITQFFIISCISFVLYIFQ